MGRVISSMKRVLNLQTTMGYCIVPLWLTHVASANAFRSGYFTLTISSITTLIWRLEYLKLLITDMHGVGVSAQDIQLLRDLCQSGLQLAWQGALVPSLFFMDLAHTLENQN